ncbi:hypothetical protein ACOMHN_012267 [Nucella lapillus]
MAAFLLLLVVTSVVTLCAADKNFTVTHEVTLEFEVKNFNGEGDDLDEKVVIGIFGDTTPVTALNFNSICNGYKRKNQHLAFKNTYCHRLVKDMLIQCGDVLVGDGTGSASIYSERFNDENFIISHSSGGIVSMANHGTDTNGSQFFILFGTSRFLDKKHVAFGKVLKGFKVLQVLNRVGPTPEVDSTVPNRSMRIVDCKAEAVKKYELSAKDMKTDDLEEK